MASFQSHLELHLLEIKKCCFPRLNLLIRLIFLGGPLLSLSPAFSPLWLLIVMSPRNPFTPSLISPLSFLSSSCACSVTALSVFTVPVHTRSPSSTAHGEQKRGALSTSVSTVTFSVPEVEKVLVSVSGLHVSILTYYQPFVEGWLYWFQHCTDVEVEGPRDQDVSKVSHIADEEIITWLWTLWISPAGSVNFCGLDLVTGLSISITFEWVHHQITYRKKFSKDHLTL